MPNVYTELHIKNSSKQLIELVKLTGKYTLNCGLVSNVEITTIKNAYAELVYYLEDPLNDVITKHPFVINDNDIINDKRLSDCCRALYTLEKFKDYTDYTVHINYVYNK